MNRCSRSTPEESRGTRRTRRRVIILRHRPSHVLLCGPTNRAVADENHLLGRALEQAVDARPEVRFAIGRVETQQLGTDFSRVAAGLAVPAGDGGEAEQERQQRGTQAHGRADIRTWWIQVRPLLAVRGWGRRVARWLRGKAPDMAVAHRLIRE